MLRNEPRFYEPIEATIARFFYDGIYLPILSVIENAPKLNAISAVVSAIRSGRVRYKDGVFYGKFTVAISRELARFAAFDSRSKTWKGDPPIEIKAASVVAETKRRTLQDRMNAEIDRIEAEIDRSIAAIVFPVDSPLFRMDEAIKRDFYDIGVMPDFSPRTIEDLRSEYIESNRLDIKRWMPDQIVRLREMVKRVQTSEGNESLLDIISREWEVSQNKARFLARQETSLFFSKIALSRASEAGIRKYRWSTSHDERVRDERPGGRKRHAPNHKHLDGKIFDVNGEGGIVDLVTGRRAHAGEDYNCRCGKIWIV